VPPTKVSTDGAPGAIGPYSQGIVANGFLFTAGQVALDPTTGQMTGADVGAQTDRALANLQAVLAAAGLGWQNVVKTTVYLQRMSDFAAMNEVYTRVMGDARPARSTVEVGALPRGALVEIDLIAALER
jgi:2-iminobutanoate/2-iminopropanoate deaminase